MKAMVYRGNKNLNLEDVDEPVPEEDEVKLEVDYCGICATDIEEYLFVLEPLVELAGELLHPVREVSFSEILKERFI